MHLWKRKGLGAPPHMCRSPQTSPTHFLCPAGVSPLWLLGDQPPELEVLTCPSPRSPFSEDAGARQLQYKLPPGRRARRTEATVLPVTRYSAGQVGRYHEAALPPTVGGGGWGDWLLPPLLPSEPSPPWSHH